MGKKGTILVVDDEHGVRQSFNMVFKGDYHVFLAHDAQTAIDIFSNNAIDLILLDIVLPDADGIDLLKQFKGLDANVEIIMVTAVKSIQKAVQAIKLGAYDYIVKPFVVDEIINIVSRALEKYHLMKELTYLRDELEKYHPFNTIIGEDKKMKAVFDLVSAISDSDGTVLIQGESGTGKELIARAIHKLGTRKKKPFVVINCAAIPKSLMESELFGHAKGAFTGAMQHRMGKLEIADKGVVFLDDVDTLDISMQAKFLRVLQEKEFGKLGSTKIIKIDVRFIAASNKDIRELISQGTFREDLYYRLNVFPVKIPPLRERRSDIPLLLEHFLDVHFKKLGKPRKRFTEGAIQILTDQYDWPGNVRELQNLVERLCTIVKGNTINPADISGFNVTKKDIKNLPLKEAVSHFEQQYIYDTLEMVEGNKKKAAEILGIHRNTLINKIGQGDEDDLSLQ